MLRRPAIFKVSAGQLYFAVNLIAGQHKHNLTATQAIAMLCSRNMTAVQYVQALFGHYDAGGFECLNAFVSLNRTQVGSSEAFILGCKQLHHY